MVSIETPFQLAGLGSYQLTLSFIVEASSVAILGMLKSHSMGVVMGKSGRNRILYPPLHQSPQGLQHVMRRLFAYAIFSQANWQQHS